MTAILVVRADAPAQVTQMEATLDGKDTLSWCGFGASLEGQFFDVVLLANADRTPDAVDWVAREVTSHLAEGGRYQWRDKT